MSYLTKSKSQKSTEYSMVYSNMGGVDFSGDGANISRGRFAYLENMYRDYEGDGGGIIESIPGYRSVVNLNERCNGLFSYKNSNGDDMIVAHAGTSLYEFKKPKTDATPTTAKTAGVINRKSSAFAVESSLFVLDGDSIFKLSSEYRGKISDSLGNVYVPLTHINGTEVEQRNLLTRRFTEKYMIGSADTLAFGNRTLKFSITDEEKKLCKVTGLGSTIDTKLSIPSRTKIGDTYYTVTEIGAGAFKNNESIIKCNIASGVTKIGNMAFSGCLQLTEVILPDSLSVIGDAAFAECENLEKVHIGQGISDIGLNSFSTCYSLTEVDYAGDERDLSRVENTNSLGEREINYNVRNDYGVISIPIHSPCISVERVTLDGEEIPYALSTWDGLCTSLKLTFTDKKSAEGKTLILEGTLASLPLAYEYAGKDGFVRSHYSRDFGDVASVISECRVCALYDGRVFLSGNPHYPGYVFFSTTDRTGENCPTYFGEFNYFKDGSGNASVTSLLKCGNSLAVFKDKDDGSGSIFYHSRTLTGNDIIPVSYPVNYVHSGFCAKGEAISFFDDALFVCDKGISALEKKNINLDNSIVTRSSNINPRLLREDLSAARLAVWRGYLAVSVGADMYLADSRSSFIGREGNAEYEWYYLSGIGSYKNDETVYKYASAAHEGYLVSDKCDEKTEGTVMSENGGGGLIYYVIENGQKYEVYPTEEKTGGTFYPAKEIMAIDDLLFFATDSGEICVFNNDKRGVPPPHIKSLPGFDESEYKKAYGRRIHPYYYSFSSHAPRYAITTKKDNCNIPNLTKSTSKRSLTLKCQAISQGKIICEVGCDKNGYSEICTFPGGDASFFDVSFNAFTLSTDNSYTVSIGEKLKNWVEKQITIYTNEFSSPFGIYSIAYRFTISGKMKKQYNK